MLIPALQADNPGAYPERTVQLLTWHCVNVPVCCYNGNSLQHAQLICSRLVFLRCSVRAEASLLAFPPQRWCQTEEQRTEKLLASILHL